MSRKDLLGQPSEVRFADRYTIESEAGQGGMGTVYRARDHHAGDALVALKIMHAGRQVDEARFSREAEVLSQLSHPRIVRYLAHGRSPDDEPYLVMAWLEGMTLSRHLERVGKLGWREVVTLGIGICEALEAAHAAQLVHRDLKPANLFLIDGAIDGVCVLDFGIARVLAGESSVDEAPTNLTRTGELLGTAGYLAPEQARGSKSIDARTDLFSLGCVLYRASTGVSAFGGEHVLDALSKLLTEVPLPAAERCVLPLALDALVAELMSKDPSARPPSAREVRERLLHVADAPGPLSEGSPSSSVGHAVIDEAAPTLASGAEANARASNARRSLMVAVMAIAASVAVMLAWQALDGPRSEPSGAVPSGDVVSVSEHDALMAQCQRWARMLAEAQHEDGSFGIERHRSPMGWATAQALYALRSARERCDEASLDVSIERGMAALDRFTTEGGVRGDDEASIPQAGASAWALLASVGRAPTERLALLRRALVASAASDGGLCTHAPCEARTASPYVTVLGAWALQQAQAGESEADGVARTAALAWLRRELGDPASEISRVEGLAEQAITVLLWAEETGDEMLALVRTRLEATVAECALRPTAAGPRCERGPGRIGETWLDREVGPGPNLVTFWFPWTVLLTHAASDPELALDDELRTSVEAVRVANLARVLEGLDMLEAAPTYEVAEFVVMASQMIAAR